MPSAESAASPRRSVLRWFLLAAFMVLAYVGFRLFEPVLVWNIGWRELPPSKPSDASPDAQFIDQAWREVAPQAAQRLREAQARMQAPAISAAIAIDGNRVWAGAVGFADIAANQRITLDSRFRLGSTSKAVTAVALGTLLDAGRLDIDLPVGRYLPDLPEPLAAVTTRQAISHTAGVRNYGLCLCFPVWEHLNRRHFTSVRDALRVFENDPLQFPPGTGFAYSSYGANVAGAVIEAAAATPFLEYLDRAVFEPLEMHGGGGDLADADVPGRVAFYETKERRYKSAFAVDNSIRWPSGGLIAAPSDMLLLGNAMLDDRLLSGATRKLLLTPQLLADGSANPQGYALGWRVSNEKKLFDGSVITRMYSHHGTAVGSTSYFAVYPEFGLVISLMMNKGQEEIAALASEADALVEIYVAERRRRSQTPP